MDQEPNTPASAIRRLSINLDEIWAMRIDEDHICLYLNATESMTFTVRGAVALHAVLTHAINRGADG